LGNVILNVIINNRYDLPNVQKGSLGRKENKKKTKNKSPSELSLKSYICPAWIKCGRGPASIWELNYLFCLSFTEEYGI